MVMIRKPAKIKKESLLDKLLRRIYVDLGIFHVKLLFISKIM